MWSGLFQNRYRCPRQLEIVADSFDCGVQARFEAWLHPTGCFARVARFGSNSRAGLLERQADTAVYSTQATMQIEETEVKPGRRLNYNLSHFGINTQEKPFPQMNLIFLA